MADTALEIHIRPLRREDDRSSFRCGNIELDRFFQRFAGQNQFRHHIGTTYVAVQGKHIAGFATVSSGELTATSLSKHPHKKLPAYPMPILRIARLAVNELHQGLGIGKLLLRAMLALALEMRDKTGCTGVVVDAKPQTIPFYEKLGFQPLELASGALGEHPEPVAMFLPITVIGNAAPTD